MAAGPVKTRSNRRDIVVIGGGAGGLVVASVASQLGLRTTLIERRDRLGGDCLHFGCIPSKSLLRAAHGVQAARAAHRYGLAADRGDVDIGRVNAFVQRAVEALQQHDSDERFEALGCEVIHAAARFVSRTTVSAGNELLSASRFVIATGSIPSAPPIPGIEDIDYLTNEDMFSLDALPGSLLVLGGGPVGVEMAQAWARLGSRVTIVEQAESLLPSFDAEIAAVLKRQLEADGVEVLHGPVHSLQASGGAVRAELNSGRHIVADRLLVAAGRAAVTGGLGLDAAGVEFDARGIRVNRRMQTTNRRVYAVGDVTGIAPLTHVAEQQAGVVIANVCFRMPRKMDYRAVPSVIYTEPEVAQVGMSVADALRDPACSVVRFGYPELDRAVADDMTPGMLKIVVRKGRVVGAHVAGHRAGEVIHELALAVACRLKLSRLAGMIHAYPTYAQLVRRTAGQYYKARLFSAATRRLVRLLNRWLP